MTIRFLQTVFIASCLLSISVNGFAQDSLNMKRMAVLSGFQNNDYNDIWGYRHGGQEFAVLGSDISMNIINVSDCANPVLEYQWTDGDDVVWRDFKDYGDYIYGVCDGGACHQGLQVINKNDFTDKYNTTIDFRSAHNIYIDKSTGRLYVAGTNTYNHGLIIYDVKTTPGTPILLKKVNFRTVTGNTSGNYYVHDLYVQNDTAYCSHGWAGYRIWDMQDVNSVGLITEFDNGTGGYNHSSWKHPEADFMYVAEEVPIGKPMYVYDIGDIVNPFEEYTFKDPLEEDSDDNRPHNPFVFKDRLYISYYHDGIQVYDVSDPALPTRIAYYDTYLDNNGNGYSGYEGAWGTYPFLPSGCILVSDITYGLNTFKMDYIPESKSRITENDIMIDSDTYGVVFVNKNDEFHRITVNSGGGLVYTNIGSEPTNKVEVINSNLQFDRSFDGVILKGSDVKYFRLKTTNAGTLYTESVDMDSGLTPVQVQNTDLYFSQYQGGLILKAVNGDDYHFTIDALGGIQSTLMD